MAEFAYNNGYQERTKDTPFFANYGTNPEYQAIGHLIQGRTPSPEDMSQLHDTLQAEMREAQMPDKEYYDPQRKPDPKIQQGDMVWLLPRNIRTTRACKKLDYKKIGPSNILANIGTSVYKLDLPVSMRIHNTFNITLLEVYNDNQLRSQRSEPPPPIVIERQPEYELEAIIDSQLHYNKLQYRAKCTGYSPEHDKTWYPADNFENANLAKRNFHSRYPDKPPAIKLEEQGNGDILISVSQVLNQEEAPPPQENWGTTIGMPEMKPTRTPYRSPSASEKAEPKQKEHDALH